MEVSTKTLQIKEIEGAATWPLRHEVMWPHKPLDYVKLPRDDQGMHYGLFLNGLLVAVVSLFISGKEAQFRKLATLEAYQGKGFGSRMVQYILGVCASKGIQKIWCNARKDKISFYTKY